MVGRLVFGDGLTATLEDSGRWTSQNALLAKLLNLRFSPVDSLSDIPSVGVYGMEQGRQSAVVLSGVWEPEKRENKQPQGEVVY
jgi:hypothetical protein